ncbi:MAG: methionine--tRNA ligase [Patescibacteria group bacterium]|nr:methionine--tRNA ligase [Patescibacteria group bacterium]
MFITTSIAYTNAPPHIGFALELLQADVIARYNRQQSVAVYFLTGTDEHGHKIAKKAEEEGKTPQQFVDEITEKYKLLTEKLNISNDDFIRTTDQERHWKGVYKMWNKLKESGDIYKKKYEGLYCVGCEAFKREKELVDGKCPEHNKEPEVVKEENYFFRLSKYEKEIKKLIQGGTLEVIPKGRKKEILNFLDEGLEDISVSRNANILKWGIPVPDDDSQVLYVWVDALTNYISALGYGDKEENFKKHWPADIHFIGKDILRFHAVIWIGMLLSAGLQPPKKILSHGHITSQGKKMSKTLGNVVDPFTIIEKYGVDPVRYYLLSEIPTFSDGDFSENRFIEKYNADLADGVGNLTSRIISLAKKHPPVIPASFVIPAKAGIQSSCHCEEQSDEAIPSLKQKTEEYHQLMEELRISEAIEKIWEVIHLTDKYIEKEKPWEKKESSKQAVKTLFSTLNKISEMLTPILPETAKKIKQQLKTKQKQTIFPKLY